MENRKEISIDQLRKLVGKEIGLSKWFVIDQEMINEFAKLTGDDQFHHTDPERAKLTPFGGTIAHGLLTLSLLRAMFEESNAPRVHGMTMAISYGANRLRFTAPVRSGGRVRGRFVLSDLVEKDPRTFMQTFEFTVEIENEEKPALIAEWLIMLIL
ncbi:acyl dehydratase [Bradyrhizobium sp. USDA 4011]